MVFESHKYFQEGSKLGGRKEGRNLADEIRLIRKQLLFEYSKFLADSYSF